MNAGTGEARERRSHQSLQKCHQDSTGTEEPRRKDDYNVYSYVHNDPINSIDATGTETFRINRDLRAIGDLLGGTTASSIRNPVTHTFGVVTNSDGSIAHTYSWGNDANLKGWSIDQPIDIQTARQALDKGKAERVGDSSLDPFIDRAYQAMNKKEYEHANWVVVRNCKSELTRLIGLAKSIQTVENSVASKRGYESVKVNSNETVTGSYHSTGSRIARKVTCDKNGKCTSN